MPFDLDIDKLIAFALALWALASAFVALTPSTKDDAALGKVRSFFERLSFFQPKTSPGLLSMPGKRAAPPKPDREAAS